jgi:hypothetical protein
MKMRKNEKCACNLPPPGLPPYREEEVYAPQ